MASQIYVLNSAAIFRKKYSKTKKEPAQKIMQAQTGTTHLVLLRKWCLLRSTLGHLYKSKLRRDASLREKFYPLHIRHMQQAKIFLAPSLT